MEIRTTAVYLAPTLDAADDETGLVCISVAGRAVAAVQADRRPGAEPGAEAQLIGETVARAFERLFASLSVGLDE